MFGLFRVLTRRTENPCRKHGGPLERIKETRGGGRWGPPFSRTRAHYLDLRCDQRIRVETMRRQKQQKEADDDDDNGGE